MTQTNYDGLNAILRAAEKHGFISEPDHEIGDLQEALKFAWELLNEDQRQALVQKFFDDIADEDSLEVDVFEDENGGS